MHVECQLNTQIKSVQSDCGGEYHFSNTFFTSCGVHHRIACPHTHEQNGSVERRHRHHHVIETSLSLLS